MEFNDRRYKYAGFWRRLLASLVDGIVIILAHIIFAAIIILILYGIMHLSKTDAATKTLVWAVAGFIGFLISLWGVWMYFALMESSANQGTLGKMALGIKVTGTDGNVITFEKATARHFSKIISHITIGVGFLMAAFSSRKQSLHDLISNCVVVDKYWQ